MRSHLLASLQAVGGGQHELGMDNYAPAVPVDVRGVFPTLTQ